MKFEEVLVGKVYKAISSHNHCFETGERIVVIHKYEVRDEYGRPLVEAQSVDSRFDNEGVPQTLDMSEVCES